MQARSIEGQFAELGVYKGGTAKMLSAIAAETGKNVHLFDTFSGMPQTDKVHDKHQEGDFADTSLESVQAYLTENVNARFHPGWFPESTAGVEDETFCFVHVDADIYQSTKDACAYFYPRLTLGGMMIFHDYAAKSCPGMRRAVHEYFDDKSEKPLFLPPNQCLIIKL